MSNMGNITLLTAGLRHLRAGASGTAGYSTIGHIARQLGQREHLEALGRMIPELGRVVVTCDVDRESEGAPYVDAFQLVMKDETAIHLFDVDAEDCLDNDKVIGELLTAMGQMPEQGLDNGVPVAAISAVEELYHHLNALPRQVRLVVGDTSYPIPEVSGDELADLKAVYPNLTKRNTWLLFSSDEQAQGEDGEAYGYWNNADGWTVHEAADGYFCFDRYRYAKPLGDARWVRSSDLAAAQCGAVVTRQRELGVQDWFRSCGAFDFGSCTTVEVHGVGIQDGAPVVNDHDPLFYGVYCRKPGQPKPTLVASFCEYEDAFALYCRINATCDVPMGNTCGNADHWFEVVVGAGLRQAADSQH